MKPHYTSFFNKGNKVYIREISQDGTRNNFSVAYKPKLYIETHTPNCEYKTLDGTELHEVEFSSISAARDYADAYKGKLYGYPRFPYACVDDTYPEEIQYDFTNLRICYIDIEVKSDDGYSSVDNPYQPICLIQLLFNNKIYIFGYEFYESYDDDVIYVKCDDEIDMLKKFVKFFRKVDPDIISGWHSAGYDIPMLHNRMQRLELEEDFKKLSPFNMVETSTQIVFGKEQLRVDIRGIQHLDLQELTIKFDNKKYENMKLDTVAKAILKRGKVEYDGKLGDLYYTDFPKFVEYGIEDVKLLRDIEQAKNFIRLVVTVAYMDKTNFIDAFSQVRMWDNQIMTYLKHNYKVQVPYKLAKDDDEFVEDSDDKFEGAFVYEPVPGKYEWVMSDDVQSMHPSIIMSFNISPETYLGNAQKNVEFFLGDTPQFTQKLVDDGATCLANGAMFDNRYEGFLPKLVRRVFNMRVEAKNKLKKAKQIVKDLETQDLLSANDAQRLESAKMEAIENDTIQNALKVKINSMFGFLGNKYSRFYQLDMAEGITLTSQVMLKSGAQEIEAVIREHIQTDDTILKYGDTDSLLYSMKGIVDKFVPKGKSTETIVEFLDRFHKKYIAPRLSEKMIAVQTRMNAREHSIRFVRDVISDITILVAKKRYIMRVWDSEGVRYTEPDLKIMGIDSVKTSTPQYCRDKIKESIDVILNNTNQEFIEFIANTKNQFMKLSVEEIASPRKVNNIDKWVEETKENSIFDEADVNSITHISGTPIQVKGSIFHNKLILEKGLSNWYMPITNGDSIKFVYLKSPNPIRSNVIAFTEKLPKEFNLHKYVDYELQWDKTFYSPVKALAKLINWDMEQTNAIF